MTLKAAIYARQSINNAEGIGRQVTRCTSLIQSKDGWELVLPPYEDNDTSASKTRGADTAWSRMLEDAKAGKFQVIVAVDMDRLLRNITDLSALTDAGVAVLTVSGEIDLTTADGKFRATMLAAIAEFETKRKGERHLRANADRVAKGLPVPGRRRFGYERDNITPREPEASEVRAMFEAVNTGTSLRSLALARGWTPRRLRDTLTNPSYKGYVVHHGNATPGAVTPLVTEEVWNEANLRLADPTRKTSPGSAVKHLASGIAVCGECGAHLHYMRGYKCSQSGAHVHIKKELLEQALSDEVLAWAFDPEGEDLTATGELLELLTESSALADERSAVEDLFTRKGADRKALGKRLDDIGEEQEQLASRIELARVSGGLVNVLAQVRAGWWERRASAEWTEVEEAAVEAWPAYWEGLPLETRRDIVRALFRVKVGKFIPGTLTQERIHIEPISE